MSVLHSTVRDLPRPSQDAHGDQLEWAALVPSAWQALSDPSGVHPWPSFPPDEAFSGAWFTPAMHLLAYGAGWPRLDLGAWWWRSVGFPVDEPVLALVDEILGSRRDELVAWLVTSPWSVDLSNVIADATGTTLPESGAPSVDRAWLADVERTSTDAGPYSSGGTDVLHLAIHTMSPIEDAGEPASRARWLVGAPSDRRAVLVVDQYAGWYRELARRAASLPPLPGDRSWRIDVVCSPVGHLGTYRRSRLTGRWFCTRHGVHQAGWGDG